MRDEVKALARRVKKDGLLEDRIRLHYLSEDYQLSKSDNDILQRIIAIRELQKSGYETREIAVILANDFGVSQSTIYRDCKRAQSIFGDMLKASAEAEILSTAELMKRIARKSYECGDMKSAVRASANYVKILRPYAEDNHIDDDDPKTFVIEIKTEGQRKKKTVDMSNFHKVEDAEFEEIADTVLGKHIGPDRMLDIMDSEDSDKEEEDEEED
ncbi:hypothetical protein FUAX_55640 (plasmid) [Fulvitalea axinellae]|uniref:Uncharacterized protein n=2 Tax=Fulvitalea axinellae TaxID=1182444 RepID=A0AAU9D6X0_9BACT|nr:hypothetical protein FUAX_55640 [Fulvitalea axinellae]